MTGIVYDWPLRPAQEATNPKTSPVPPIGNQPGLGRVANQAAPPGPPLPNLNWDRVGAEIERRRQIAAGHKTGG